MSRKYNTKHPLRGRSHYGRRLQTRGLSHTPVMPDADYLRRRQGTETWLSLHPAIVANLEAWAKKNHMDRPTPLAESLEEVA